MILTHLLKLALQKSWNINVEYTVQHSNEFGLPAP
jgi:hypothetical protein